MSERCGWAGQEKIYTDYHDTEWGVPEYDSRALWEKLILDGFQAGLSWITILKKRDNFKAAFAQFDPKVIAGWGEPEVLACLENPGIIRHRGKIEATITNARAYLEVDDFSAWCWANTSGKPIHNRWTGLAQVPALTPLSTQMSKDLRKAGFKFCGPTIVYAWMQACGLINDHLIDCPQHDHCAALAR